MIRCIVFLFCLLISLGNYSIAEEQTATLLQPKIRSELLSKTRYILDSKTLLPFLSNMVVFEDQEEIDALPYVLGYLSSRILGGVGDEIFVKGIVERDISTYSFLGEFFPFFHPDTGEYLGIQSKIIGAAELYQTGDPALFKITQSDFPIEQGARLLPRVSLNLANTIQATAPTNIMQGYVLSVVNGLWEMGKYSLAVLSLGQRDGLAAGHVLDIIQSGRNAVDPLSVSRDLVQVPEEKFGEILIYKTFQKLSVGVILDAKRPVVLQDIVVSKGEAG